MEVISADAVIEGMARRDGGAVSPDLAVGLRQIWDSVAGDLTAEEAAAVLWQVAPLQVVVGSSHHAAARVRLARALYPSSSPAAAVSKFRAVCKRASVRSVVSALRAEESEHRFSQRATVREELWRMVNEPAPEFSEPKDINAHRSIKLAAIKALVALDGLDQREPERDHGGASGDARKKLLDRLGAIGQIAGQGEST